MHSMQSCIKGVIDPWGASDEPSEHRVDKSSTCPEEPQVVGTAHIMPTQQFSTGSRYVGQWDNLRAPAGSGIFRFPYGVQFNGEIRDGMFHGSGSLAYPSGGKLVQAKWDRGILKKCVYVYQDGMEHSDTDFVCCSMPDRRFYTEKLHGLKTAGRSQLTNNIHGDREIPKGCYDAGDGFYNPVTKCVHNAYGRVLRIPSSQEEDWIVSHCRKAWDENVGLDPRLFEGWWYSPLYPDISEGKLQHMNIEYQAVENPKLDAIRRRFARHEAAARKLLEEERKIEQIMEERREKIERKIRIRNLRRLRDGEICELQIQACRSLEDALGRMLDDLVLDLRIVDVEMPGLLAKVIEGMPTAEVFAKELLKKVIVDMPSESQRASDILYEAILRRVEVFLYQYLTSSTPIIVPLVNELVTNAVTAALTKKPSVVHVEEEPTDADADVDVDDDLGSEIEIDTEDDEDDEDDEDNVDEDVDPHD